MVKVFDLDHMSNLSDVKNITTNNNGKNNTIHFANHSSGKFFWNIIGSKLEVYSFEQGGILASSYGHCNSRLVASFNFEEIFNDCNITISHVIQLVDRFEVTSRIRHPNKLIVILNLTSIKNYICIVDIRLNIVVNTIEFPFNLTCVEVISSGPKENVENMPLINELRCMNGCLALGCQGGLVFIMDLILDSYSPEPLVAKKISMITHNSAHIDMNNKRRTAIFHNQVICIGLNIDAKNKGKFNYRANDGTMLASLLTSQVYVSALHFVPQSALLCVGYNFGGFHLYNLNWFTLECSCDVDSDLLPVIKFAYQVPENDPKNYSYLWAVRGVNNGVSNDEINDESIAIQTLSSAFVYLLCYQNKRIIKNYGIFYDTFKLCCCKFEFPLSGSYEKSSIRKNGNCSSKLLDMFTIHRLVPAAVWRKSSEDDQMQSFPIDYNYLLIAWQTTRFNDEDSSFYFIIFDLNQWYISQMPKSFCVDDDGLCPFMSVYSLDKLCNHFHRSHSPIIQSINFSPISLVKYGSTMHYADIHSYPASLSFTMTVASGSQLCNVSYYGMQKKILNHLNSCASNVKILVDHCQEILAQCLRCGLIANANGDQYCFNRSAIGHDQDRSALFQLLNVSLENNVNSLLKSLIQPEPDVGLESKLVLEWIWQKIQSIKNSIDLLSKPLFDMSGGDVSRQDISKLVCYQSHLTKLKMLLEQMLANSGPVSNKLRARIEVAGLIGHYLKFILIFENLGLLPDQDPRSANHSRPSIYSYEKLSKFYDDRRKNLMAINGTLLQDGNVLLIDILVETFRPQLSSVWKGKHAAAAADDDDDDDDDDENKAAQLYPPPDLSSLTQIFLLDSIPLIYKESILLYLIHDLSHFLSEHPCLTQKLLIFVSSLNIGQGVRNFVEGLWFLDHQDYEPALQLFTHPMVTISLNDFKVNIDLFNRLITRIIELYLFENQFKKAMIFSMSCNHVLLDQEQNENLYIQILLLNGNLSGAFEFQRRRRASYDYSYRLLYKLFFVCEKMNTLVQVCRMPLDSFEENVFTDYLLNSSQESSKMILVLYFILSNKLMEAIRISKQFEQQLNQDDESKNILNLIDAYLSVLPSSSLDMINRGRSDPISIDQDDNLSCMDSPVCKLSKPDWIGSKHKELAKKRPLVYLSPGFSKSKITKSKRQHNGMGKIFSILKTPTFKDRTAMNTNVVVVDSESVSVTRPILKKIAQSSATGELDESSKALNKVSFLFNEETHEIVENLPQPDYQPTHGTLISDQVNRSPDKVSGSFSTPIMKKSRMFKKSIDSPNPHRMTLRSNKKN